MDVIALCSAEGEVFLHRLSWVRLMSMPHSAKVTSMSWSPSGTLLGLAGDDGSLVVVDIELGPSPLLTLQAGGTGSGALCVLKWVSIGGGEAKTLESRGEGDVFVPWPSGISEQMEMMLGGNAGEYVPNTGFPLPLPPRIPRTRKLEVLVGGDEQGTLALYAHGCVAVLEVELGGPVGSVALGPELGVGVVVYQGGEEEGEGGRSLVLQGFSTPPLAAMGPDAVSGIVRGVYETRGILSSLDQTLAVAVRMWNEGIASYSDKMDEYKKLIRAYASDSSVEDELLTMLASGTASASLLQFVTQTLGEKAIGKLAKSLDAACSKVATIVLHALLPGVHRAIASLSDLSGDVMALSTPVPGLSHPRIQGMIETAGKFKLKLEELLLSVEEMSVNFHEFLKWLSVTYYRLSELPLPPQLLESPPDTLNVAAFLSRPMTLHKVSLLLGRDPIPVPDLLPDAVSEAQLPFVRLVDNDPAQPLGAVLDELLAFDAGKGIGPAMGDSVVWTSPISLTEPGHQFATDASYDPDQDRFVVLGWDPSHGPDIVILTLDSGLSRAAVCTLTPPGPVVQISFYTPTQIAILLGTSDSHPTAAFLLLDLDDLEWKPIVLGTPDGKDTKDKEEEEEEEEAIVIDPAVPLLPYVLTLLDPIPIPEETRSRPLRDDSGYIFAVSGSRGVGAIIGEGGEVLLLDVEDDEDDEEEDEDDEDDEDGDGDDGDDDSDGGEEE